MAIANILKDDVSSPPLDAKVLTGMEIRYGHGVDGKRRTSKSDDLVMALQSLVQFSGLLCPPDSVLDEANRAAAKAAYFISLSRSTKGGIGSEFCDGTSAKAGYLSKAGTLFLLCTNGSP